MYSVLFFIVAAPEIIIVVIKPHQAPNNGFHRILIKMCVVLCRKATKRFLSFHMVVVSVHIPIIVSLAVVHAIYSTILSIVEEV